MNTVKHWNVDHWTIDLFDRAGAVSGSEFLPRPEIAIRRIVPSLIAADILGVQPMSMSGELGMLFKMRYQPKMLAESEIPPVD